MKPDIRQIDFTPMLQLHVRRLSSQVAAAFLRLVAVACPAPLALLTALYIGRPLPFFLANWHNARGSHPGLRWLEHPASWSLSSLFLENDNSATPLPILEIITSFSLAIHPPVGA
jgi:hypothetical protein